MCISKIFNRLGYVKKSKYIACQNKYSTLCKKIMEIRPDLENKNSPSKIIETIQYDYEKMKNVCKSSDLKNENNKVLPLVEVSDKFVIVEKKLKKFYDDCGNYRSLALEYVNEYKDIIEHDRKKDKYKIKLQQADLYISTLPQDEFYETCSTIAKDFPLSVSNLFN